MRPFLFVLALLATPALAQFSAYEVPDNRVVLSDLQAFRFQPLGTENFLRMGFQKRLFRSDLLALKNNYAFLGAAPRLTPASVKIGPSVEIQPASFFNLRLGSDFVQYFGSFGALQSFPNPLRANFTDAALASGAEAGRNYAAPGLRLILEPTLQMMVGPIALRNRIALEYWRMGVHPGDTSFYEQALDTVISARGFLINDDLDLLYLHPSGKWIAGARYSLVQPLYSQRDFPDGDVARNGNRTQRLGALGAYVFFDNGPSNFNRPMVVSWVSWLLEHPWRTQSGTSNAIPQVVVAFSFESDFLLGR